MMLLVLLGLGGSGWLIARCRLGDCYSRKDEGACGDNVKEFHKIFSWCSPVDEQYREKIAPLLSFYLDMKPLHLSVTMLKYSTQR